MEWWLGRQLLNVNIDYVWITPPARYVASKLYPIWRNLALHGSGCCRDRRLGDEAYFMSQVRRSILFRQPINICRNLLIVTTMVMARILTPAETGLYLTANAVIMLADNFRNFGVSVYIVQERDLSRVPVRSAFTVTLILSLAMGTTIYLGAGSVASFYASPELKTLLIVSAFGFLPFRSQARSWRCCSATWRSRPSPASTSRRR